MRASEVIKQMQKIISEHGDAELRIFEPVFQFYNDDFTFKVPYAETEDKVKYIEVCHD